MANNGITPNICCDSDMEHLKTRVLALALQRYGTAADPTVLLVVKVPEVDEEGEEEAEEEEKELWNMCCFSFPRNDFIAFNQHMTFFLCWCDKTLEWAGRSSSELLRHIVVKIYSPR